MSARDEVLDRVRAALGDTRRPLARVPRSYRDARPPEGDLLDLFAERVEDYRANVLRCRAADLAGTVAGLLHGIPGVVVPEELGIRLPGVHVDDGRPPGELDAVGAVVTRAAVAVATTGTIVLDHGPGQGRRALTLVPDHHICVVEAHQVVAGVPEAVARLDPRRPQTWISGPSATSDIELTRVEGVHGPRTLDVVIVA